MGINLRKIVAVAVAVLMCFALSSTGAFATEIEEITDAPVIELVEIDVPVISVNVENIEEIGELDLIEEIEEIEEIDIGELLVDDFDIMSTGDGNVTTNIIESTDSDIIITSVTATKKVVDDVTFYNVKLEYTMPAQVDVPQVTFLCYLFSNTVPETVEETDIKAMDQKKHEEVGEDVSMCEGEFSFVLSSEQAGVSDDATLVLMVGSNASLDNRGPQAVAIDLSSAYEAPTTWEAIGAIVSTSEITAPSDADEDAIMALLAGITATVTDGSNTATAAVENWTTTGTIEPGAELTYTGTVVADDSVWTSEETLTVTVTVVIEEEAPTTWEATGATVAPATLDVAADATDATIKAQLADAVVTVTGADGKSSTNVSVAWATTDAIVAGTTVTYTGTVTPAADADWTGTQTVTVTVVIEEEAPTTWEATGATVAPDTLNVAADATDATIKAQLADAVVTVTGADGKSSTNVSVAWATTDEIVAGTTVTYTGTVTPAADADWTGTQTVTVTVVIEEAQGGDPDEVLLGDIDGNGVLEFADVLALNAKVAKGVGSVETTVGDVDGNGLFEFADVLALNAKISRGVAFPNEN